MMAGMGMGSMGGMG